MPNMAQHQVSPLVRTLLIGDSGGGKTGSLASLVTEAGYRLFVADFDNGLDVLYNIVKTRKASGLSQIEYETFRVKYKVQGDKLVPQTADAWTRGIKWLEKVTQRPDLGENDIIVVDSLSFAAKVAMNHVLKINGRLTMAPYQSDYGDAQKLIEGLVALLTDDDIPCNVICTAHVNYQGDDEAGVPVKGLPAMIGKALNPVIPRYFNHSLLARQIGQDASLKRYIHSVTFGNIELKNTNPGVIKAKYPLETGLADYFLDARGTEPAEVSEAKAS